MTEDKVASKPQKLKILFVATESFPYASVGGIASVTSHLSSALKSMGHDIRVFIPKFGFIDEKKFPMKLVYKGLKVPTDDPEIPFLICNVKSLCQENGVTFYFLENQEYYEKRANVYGYVDDHIRFALLSRGALEFIKTEGFVPDVIHCNDWHTGILPNYLKTIYLDDRILSKIAVLFTIHNIAIQGGNLDHRHVSELDYDDGKSPISSLFNARLLKQNFMRRGILYSDLINTVSKTYSREILTPEFGEGLDKLLLELRGKMFGIINGIDYSEMNPLTDTSIEKNYDVNSLEFRRENKRALQKEFNLAISPDPLLIGFVGRLDFMKGVDLLVNALHNLFEEFDVQFVQVGGGDWGIVEMLQNLKKKFPTRVGIHTYPNFTLPRLVFSGADAIVYPSRFEPCGIVQLEAMRYGAVPVVRKVGGLADTVENFDNVSKTGTGFVFNKFNEFSLFGQLVRACEIYKDKVLWQKIQKNCMKVDYSWNFSAKEYVKVYEKCLDLVTNSNSLVPRIEGVVG
jgi:starch synthase